MRFRPATPIGALPMILSAACSEFLIHCKVAKNLSIHSLRAYGIDLQEFERFAGAETPVASIDRQLLRRYLSHLFEKRGLKETSVKRRIACLKVMFRWLELDEAIPISPFHRLDARIRMPQRLPRCLSREELRALLAEPARKLGLGLHGRYEARALDRAVKRLERFADLTALTVLEILYVTGMRVGELATLRVSDVNTAEGTIVVNGKGSRQRMVFLPDAAVTRLVGAYLTARARLAPSTDAFVITPRAIAATTQHLRAIVTDTGEAAALPRRITPHMLRHTAATHLLEAGVDIRFVQRLLGHQSISTTEGYTRVSDVSLKAVITGAGVRKGGG